MIDTLLVSLAVTAGILGLAAFLALIASVRWAITPAGISAAVFLVHGVVDTLLMTTPIYFMFWLVLGRMDADRL